MCSRELREIEHGPRGGHEINAPQAGNTSGLAFYTGDLFPQWKDSVFVGGLRGMMLDRLQQSGKKVVAEEPLLVDLHARKPRCAHGTRRRVTERSLWIEWRRR
jgi:glucose/sorbosone dehydrogenase